MTKPFSFALDAVAVYRLTKLITEDKLTEDLRYFIDEKFPPVQDKRLGIRRKSKVAYLFSCPWCISIYAAIFIVTLRRISPQNADYLSSILASSAVTGVLVSKGV
jgi:hypothetical protein